MRTTNRIVAVLSLACLASFAGCSKKQKTNVEEPDDTTAAVPDKEPAKTEAPEPTPVSPNL